MRRKRTGPKKGYKYVRVDHRTIIEVPEDRDDQEAIDKWLARTSVYTPSYLSRRKKEQEDIDLLT